MENSSIENQDHLPTKTPRRSLRLLPRAPPPSITIHHLPAELLFSVLELANSGQGWRGTAYNTFLRNAAVVCSSWSVLARELLWSEVFIAGQSEAVRLLASPALGRYKTRRLFISGDFNRNTACRVIKGVRGLQSLRLQNFTGADSVDRSWFSSAHLSELNKVVLHTCHFAERQSQTQTPKLKSPQSTLAQLEIINATGDVGPVMNYLSSMALEDFDFFQNAITSDLHFTNLLDFFQVVGPSLKSIRLITGTVLHLIPAFSAFRNLQKLYLEGSGAEVVAITQVLPSRLLHLAVAPNARKMSAPAISELVKGLTEAIQNSPMDILSSFYFMGISRVALLKAAGGEALLQQMTKRGIIVKLSAE